MVNREIRQAGKTGIGILSIPYPRLWSELRRAPTGTEQPSYLLIGLCGSRIRQLSHWGGRRKGLVSPKREFKPALKARTPYRGKRKAGRYGAQPFPTAYPLTSACALAVPAASGSPGTASHSTRALCSPWRGAGGCSLCAPLSFPRLPSAGRSAGKTFVPERAQGSGRSEKKCSPPPTHRAAPPGLPCIAGGRRGG